MLSIKQVAFFERLVYLYLELNPRFIYIYIYIFNAHKTEYMRFNQRDDISTINGRSLKLVDKFTYLETSVSSTETDINTRLAKAWTAIDRLSVIWKSDLTNKIKRSFFQAAVVSILLFGCTPWTLTERIEKKLDGNYTRILRAILNKSLRPHPTKQQLYGHLPPITKTIKVRRNRHCWVRAHKWCTPADPFTWTSKCRTASWNLHTAALYWYGM